MNILITGANGTVGCDLVEKFSKNNKVFAFFRTPNIFSDNFRSPNVKWIKQDLKNEIKHNIEPEIVIHCAVAHPFSKNNTFLDYVNSNIIALNNVIEFSNKVKIKIFIYLSSVKIYGAVDQKVLKDQDLFLEPDILAATKILSEKILSIQNFTYLNMRLPGVLCYNNSRSDRPWLNTVIQKLTNNEKVDVFNGQSGFNNIVDTHEIYYFINFIIKKKTVESASLNFSASNPIKLERLIGNLKTGLNSESKIVLNDQKTRHFIISSDRVLKIYKYKIAPIKTIINRYVKFLNDESNKVK